MAVSSESGWRARGLKYLRLCPSWHRTAQSTSSGYSCPAAHSTKWCERFAAADAAGDLEADGDASDPPLAFQWWHNVEIGQAGHRLEWCAEWSQRDTVTASWPGTVRHQGGQTWRQKLNRKAVFVWSKLKVTRGQFMVDYNLRRLDRSRRLLNCVLIFKVTWRY